MRYLWELYPAYCREFSKSMVTHALMAPLASYLRTWDYSTAARVDSFVANSWNVRRRIWKTYRRRSRVIHPPVAVERFYGKPSDGYFLMVAEMVPYKRLAYAVRTFARNGRRLKVVGDGPEYRALRSAAGPNIEFCGRVSDAELRELYARCSALNVPGEEDFGITMVEALASGKPVLALGLGGAREILRDSRGILYREPAEASLNAALRFFDGNEDRFLPAHLMAHAAEYAEHAFTHKFLELLNRDHERPLPSVVSRPVPLRAV
jgi:glycosyltransferase involved in cell wall biosynthesis